MRPGDSVPPGIIKVYETLAERYRQRGLSLPPLPTEGIKAQNLVYAMMAKLNEGRQPLRVKYNWRNPTRGKDLDGERHEHNPRTAR